ncbi:RNA methyltransferase, partial [Clostridium saudiense]|nr:RNA methyltransferase [Clostridium saudiense]
MIWIESKENTFFKLAKKLKDRKGRNKEQKYIIEGFRLVQEAFKAGCKIDSIVVNNDGEKKLKQYLEQYLDGVRVYLMEDGLFSQLTSTENPQGIIAVLEIE